MGKATDRVRAVVGLLRADLIGAGWTVEIPNFGAGMPEGDEVGGLMGNYVFLVDHSEMIGDCCRDSICVFLISDSRLPEGIESKASMMASVCEIKGCEISYSAS